ncbi:MAG: VanZ family protein [Phycisphaeraceae bacterium]|nr:VanZ family protein [Phycisphaeraceae bacterium]
MKAIRMPRPVFAGYALLLFTGTHWPNLQIRGPVERTDLWVHLGAFGTWAALAAACGFFGPVFSKRNLTLSWMTAVGYACIDEGLQAIPALGRTCAWDDLAFNVLGISLAIGGMWGLGRLSR